MTRYIRNYAGEWIQPIRRGYKAACCDCGLVHKVNFRIHAGRIQFQVFRDKRATEAKRRHEKRSLTKE
jgi:hypothetical protein